MNCPKCNNVLSEKERFCSKCGNPLFKTCIKCKQEMKLDEQFCPKCGCDNSEAALLASSQKKEKTKKKKKIVFIAILSLILAFVILQVISIFVQLHHLKTIEPYPVMYCDSIDERTGFPHYTPAYMFGRIEKGHYKINLIGMINGLPKNSETEISLVKEAVNSGISEFIYYYNGDNQLFISPDKIEDMWLSESFSIYQEDIKFIKFGWFWNPENGEITLKSGKKLLEYWYTAFPFTFEGKVVINDMEVEL